MHDEEFQVRKQQLDQGWLGALDQEGLVLDETVLVRTPRTRNVSLFRCQGMGLQEGQRVVVETERGTTEGVVLESPANRWVQIKVVRRVVRPLDRPPEGWQAQRYIEREKLARSSCHELLKRMKLDMKLVDVEHVWWENRTVFYFVAEGRVDFRDMVKELSRNLRCRIEMRQVGPRDETKMLQGYGRCGREHCCSNYLTEFHSVRTKMAKEQGIVVNQDKITGHCRKLLCCLAYERETYAALREEMPAVGSRVETPDGKGKVIELHVIRGGVKVLLEDGNGFREFPRDKVRSLDAAAVAAQASARGDIGPEDAALQELEDNGAPPGNAVIVEGDASNEVADGRPQAEADRLHRGNPFRNSRGRGPQQAGERGDSRHGDRHDTRQPGRGDSRTGDRPQSRPGDRGDRRPEHRSERMRPPATPDRPDQPVDASGPQAPGMAAEGAEVHSAGERTGRRRRRRRRGGGGEGGQHQGGSGPAQGQMEGDRSADGGWAGGPDDDGPGVGSSGDPGKDPSESA